MLTEKESQRFRKARRVIIEQAYPNLNPDQRKAVLATEGPLLLLAGAGSGKTTVLIHRVAHLLRYGRGADTEEIPDFATPEDVAFLEKYAKEPVPEEAQKAQSLCAWDVPAPWNILTITFTNKAARELKDRLEQMLGRVALDIWASTFHSLCVNILRRHIDRIGFSTQFTIYDTDDSIRVLKDILEDLHLDTELFDPRKILGRIGRAKDQMKRPDDLLDEAQLRGDLYQKTVAQIYEEYQMRLKQANALDFDDLIFHTVVLLQRFEDVRLFYQNKFRYVMVDEYQDTNHNQYLLTSLLAGGYENICVVGDDDQSIYKFRGANIENILSFEKQYQGARVIRLEQNYRSTQTILAAANQVIANNIERKGKNLWTELGQGEKITLYLAMTEEEEAQYIAGKLLEEYRKRKTWKDCAILYRMNVQSRTLENACRRNGIPYRVYGGLRFYDRAEVKDMTAYLCVINNPSDQLRLRRILNRPARGIGEKTIEAMERIAAEEHCTLWDVLIRIDEYPSLKKSASKLHAFVDMIQTFISFSQTMPLADFYEELMIQSGYIAMLQSKNTPENRVREQNVRELKSNFLVYQHQMEEAGMKPTLADFLNEISLLTDLDDLGQEQDQDHVAMMTMHSAKGLEFPVVFLSGMEEGIFPGIQALGNMEEMEEARRLCYVAITRAKEKLILTYARQRTIFGHTSSHKISRFVEEIPAQCLQRLESARQDYLDQKMWNSASSSRALDDGIPSKKKPNYGTIFGGVKPKSQHKTIALSVGDAVLHKAFGKGTICSVQPMGGDALLEIEFETSGRKRLMARAALQQMKLL